MEAAIDWVRDFLNSEEKLILFADHKFVVDEMMRAFKDVAVKIDGSVAADKRMGIVDQFQNNDDIRLFVGSKAAKEGLTLDVASNVAFVELWWTPGDHDQAEDRCYGRLSDPHGANIWYLVAMGTIEEDIAELLDKKRKVIGSILDGKPIDSPSVLTELIEAIKNK
jgi:SNF2 family DNA or RNA helicase